MVKEVQKKLILIVEDESVVKIVEDQLQRAGFLTEVAFDGLEAMEKLRHFRPDLILLDILLPKVDGFRFLEILQKDSNLKKIPVMIFSNLPLSISREKLKELGVVDYIVKSDITIPQLIDRVKGLLY